MVDKNLKNVYKLNYFTLRNRFIELDAPKTLLSHNGLTTMTQDNKILEVWHQKGCDN